MSFDYDIFISYGHLDDEDPAGEVKGWVDLLAERLPRVVASYLGEKPRIWRDELALRRNDLLTSPIEKGVTRSRLFVPILTPRYVLSEWCRKELEAFVASAGARAPHSRIFKVVKTPLLAHLKEPEALRELIGYHFYKMEGDRPHEFSPDVTPARDQRYWDMLGHLAWDIANKLIEMRKAEEEGGDAPPPAEEAFSPSPRSHDVFISFSSADEQLAKNVRAALEGADVRCWMSCDDILPGEDYGQAIIEAMNSSRLVILVFTSGSNKSRHVANEIDRAFNKDKPVILFRTEDIALSQKLEYYLSTGSWLNAWEPPMEKHLPVLVEKVKRLLAKLPRAG